jgi:hypothetical protein
VGNLIATWCVGDVMTRFTRWCRRVARAVTLVCAVFVAVAVSGAPAAAGGDWLAPVRDRYRPGDSVTLVGYTGASGALGSVADGPFFAYLRRLEEPVRIPNQLQMAPFAPLPSDLPLGELVLESRAMPGYAYRVSLAFVIPADLPAGRYGVIYCNQDCTKGLSALIGGEIFVDVDPDAAIPRSWPLDEPEIANLADATPLYGPNWQTTAAEIRAGLPPRPIGAPPAAAVPTTTPTRQHSGDYRAARAERTSTRHRSHAVVLAVIVVGITVGTAGVLLALKRLHRRSNQARDTHVPAALVEPATPIPPRPHART